MGRPRTLNNRDFTETNISVESFFYGKTQITEFALPYFTMNLSIKVIGGTEMKKTNKKSHLIKYLLAVVVLVAMLVSGMGTAKSYAYTKAGSQTVEVNCKGLVDKIVKGIYRAEDMLYKSYLDNVYGMVLNKRYEFVGSTVVKVASNSGFMKRNFDEDTVFSSDEGYFLVRDEVMDKAVQYWDAKGNMVISLYYRNKNDRKPSYVCYRFEKNNNPDTMAFFTYDMQGRLVDVTAWDGY